MMDETLHDPGTDAAAVAAVCRGDAERYRELVERHERRVFAVAWSRLGDAALAEEATQEAFIRGYRRLWLLGDGAKFSGWITSVARNVAINLGLRHRRELNKRERWALEHPATSNESESAAETDPQHTPETLRQTLAELPPAHRECLVLFYLEGKSGSEAAVALGISEAALRVRLHRARAALRERLEEKLAGALTQLRPQKTLVPAIMAGVLASTTAKAATAGSMGATFLGGLSKFAPIKWVFSLFPFLFALPMLLFSWLIFRSELANYRDPNGFRVRLFRANFLRQLIWVLLVIAVIYGFTTFGHVGQREFYLSITGLLLLLWLLTWRQLAVNRSRYCVMTTLSSGIMLVGFLLLGFHVIPFFTLSLFIGAQALMTSLIYGERPTRMDYNLFLRAAEGMLALPVSDNSISIRPPRSNRQALFAFARFLGSRWLVDSYRWSAEGLWLRLPAFRFSMWNAMGFFSSWKHRSRLLLAWDGRVSTHFCQTDQSALQHQLSGESRTAGDLERQVIAAVKTAWSNFERGDAALAERALGQVPEAEVFVMSPAQTGLARWRTKLLMVLLALILMLTGLTGFRSPWLDGLKPVSVTEAEVRAFLSLVSTNPNPLIKETIGGREGWTRKGFAWDPSMALFTCLVLPETNLFTPRGLAAMRDSVAGGSGFVEWRQSPHRVQNVFSAPLPRHAIVAGWISWSDLDLQPAVAADCLRTNRFSIYQPDKWDYFLTRGESWSWVKSERNAVMRIKSDGVTQLRLLCDLNCLDLTDREKLIRQIASVQTLSGTPPDQPPIHDWRAVRGLFFTPSWPALEDTYFSLAALEILDGLDRIDREACIRGIIKRHAGKGFFTSPDSGGYNEYKIQGDARDTLAAFESLRILGALDRVKDLEKWQFRIKSRRASKPDAQGVRTPTWEEIEAWVCQERLARIIRERKENPQAPIRSLLEP